MSDNRQLCPACDGAGFIAPEFAEPFRCDNCGGTGYIIATDTPTPDPFKDVPAWDHLPMPNELAALRQQGAAPCPECHNPDGTLNAERMSEEGSCTFGCGTVIDSGETGMCPRCRDHSANHYECETCGITYEDWDAGKWEMYPDNQKIRV